jgi:hypothetical protein
MGILDSKNRIIDAIVTEEGRRQLAAGTFKISFATFTDGNTFYEADPVSGSSDETARILFEARSKTQDSIVFEADDSGLLLPKIIEGSNIIVRNGQIVSSSNLIIANDENFASLSQDLLDTSINSFQEQYLIGTEDFFDDETGFEVSNENIKFNVTSLIPVNKFTSPQTETTDKLKLFFEDKRMAHLRNFDYLPPVDVTFKKEILVESCPDVKEYNSIYEIYDYLKNREVEEITFPETSRENNLLMQIFDEDTGILKKLDIIDYGEFFDEGSNNPVKRVFFVGKVIKDNKRGMYAFCNILTLIFE